MKVWHIKKIGDDRYHVVCTHELDEEVNGSQLMGMLNAKLLNQAQVNEIVFSLDTRDVGYRTEIIFTPEPVMSAPLAT